MVEVDLPDSVDVLTDDVIWNRLNEATRKTHVALKLMAREGKANTHAYANLIEAAMKLEDAMHDYPMTFDDDKDIDD